MSTVNKILRQFFCLRVAKYCGCPQHLNCSIPAFQWTHSHKHKLGTSLQQSSDATFCSQRAHSMRACVRRQNALYRALTAMNVSVFNQKQDP